MSERNKNIMSFLKVGLSCLRVTTGKEDVTQNFNIKTDEVSSRHKVVRKDVVVKVVVIIDVLQAVLGYYFFLVH